jgi:hypothetical protein
MLAMSACSLLQGILPPSLLQDITPPALSTAFSPSPPPPPPPGPPLTAPVPSQSHELPSPEQARAEMWQWLMTHGYKDFQAQAMLESAAVESGFNPCAAGPGGFRYTFQWGAERLRQLQEFAHTDGCPQLHTQLAFADWELRNQPQFACFWSAATEEAAYTALRRGFGRGSC